GLRHYESRIVPETGLDGRVETALVISRDITARKRAEVALRESSEFLQRMIESSRDCIKVLDLEGRLLWISAGGQRLMEIDDASSLLGKSYLDFWSGSDRDAAHNALVAALAGGVSRFEAYCPTTKRVPKWWDELVTPMLGNDGRPEKLLVVSRDITERRHTESALRESEERFRQLAENIRQVFWINTRSGDQTIYVSPAYEEIWGRSRDSLYRNPREWMRSIHTEDLPVVEDGMKKQARGENLDLEYRIIRPDGSVRWISDRSYHMKSGDGTLLACGIAEDITDRKLAEQERLNHAMQQRDALVREVHHRIKNSLQGIVGLLRQKIRKKPAIAPEIGETIAQLQSVALVYGLQETRSDGLLSLADVTEAICSSAESLIGGRVERAFERKLLRPACLAGAEAVSVAVALNELVFNALKHQPAAAGKKQARLTLREARDEAEIRISNRGRLPKGFDFARSRSVGSGLALVRTLLAPPGGNVTFNGVRNEVEVVLKLHPPLLAVRQQGAIREM
ncbi:MAG: PAS domain-containing protein, partial [Betaproteobacteria bacterium]|nr:PAS domain-containing protein [Betaproteobacteria bacterium]